MMCTETDISNLKVVILLQSAGSLTCMWQSVYKWRVDLSKSEKYWDSWFRGSSNLFLACNLPKLLLLAGKDSFLVHFHHESSQAWLSLCKCASRDRPTGQRPDHWPNARWVAVKGTCTCTPLVTRKTEDVILKQEKWITFLMIAVINLVLVLLPPKGPQVTLGQGGACCSIDWIKAVVTRLCKRLLYDQCSSASSEDQKWKYLWNLQPLQRKVAGQVHFRGYGWGT